MASVRYFGALHKSLGRIEGPESSLSALVGSVNLDEDFVETQVVSDGVLEAGPVAGEAGISGQDPLVDLVQLQHSVRTVLDGSHDELLVADLGLGVGDDGLVCLRSVGFVLALLIKDADLQEIQRVAPLLCLSVGVRLLSRTLHVQPVSQVLAGLTGGAALADEEVALPGPVDDVIVSALYQDTPHVHLAKVALEGLLVEGPVADVIPPGTELREESGENGDRAEIFLRVGQMRGQTRHGGFSQHSPVFKEKLDVQVAALDVNDEVEAGEELEILIRKWIVNFQKFTFVKAAHFLLKS